MGTGEVRSALALSSYAEYEAIFCGFLKFLSVSQIELNLQKNF
jgi:hypothetical protein